MIYDFVFGVLEELGLSAISFILTLILPRCIQQPCGCNVTGQLQEPKDLTRPATVKVVYTILYIRSRLRYYKRSYSFNPHIRFPAHFAE